MNQEKNRISFVRNEDDRIVSLTPLGVKFLQHLKREKCDIVKYQFHVRCSAVGKEGLVFGVNVNRLAVEIDRLTVISLFELFVTILLI